MHKNIRMIERLIKKLAMIPVKIPYLLAIILGIILFLAALGLDDAMISEKLSDLLLNLSASLLAIPIILYSYEIVKNRISQSQDKDVSEYVKMNVDREIITLLKRLTPLVMKYDPNTLKSYKILNITKNKAIRSLEEYNPLAFYLATDWGYVEDQFMSLIANELVYNNLSIEERNAFVKIIKELRNLDYFTDPKFFKATGKGDARLSVISGKDLDPNIKFESRFLLMRHIEATNEAVVVSFNDIKVGKYMVSLTTPMKANKSVNENIIDSILNIQTHLKVWIDKRGDEFLIDSRNFRIRNTRTRNKFSRLGLD